MSSGSGFLARSFNCYQAYGAAETFRRVLHRFKILSVQRSLDFFMKELSESSNGAPVEKCLWAFREVHVHEFEDLIYADGLPSVEWMREQFNHGSRLFAAFENGCVVATHWIHEKIAELGHIRRIVELSARAVYTHGALTAVAFRNKGIGTLLKRYLLSVLHQEGFRYVFLAVFLDNHDAMRWHLKNSFAKWGTVTYLKFANRQFWWTQLTSVGRQYSDLLKNEAKQLRAPILNEVSSGLRGNK